METYMMNTQCICGCICKTHVCSTITNTEMEIKMCYSQINAKCAKRTMFQADTNTENTDTNTNTKIEMSYSQINAKCAKQTMSQANTNT